MGIKSKRVNFTFNESSLHTLEEIDAQGDAADQILTHTPFTSWRECLYCHERLDSRDARCGCSLAALSRERRAARQRQRAGG